MSSSNTGEAGHGASKSMGLPGSISPLTAEASSNWDKTLRVAETCAIPAESIAGCPEKCELDDEMRMQPVADHLTSDFACFEARLKDPNINFDQVHRVVLLDKAVYNWILTTDSATKRKFASVIEGLKPADQRRTGVLPTKVHRRSIVGVGITFELLAASFQEGKFDRVMLFTPFVSGEVDGVYQCGIIVWVVTSDEEASMYKTLICNSEFMRTKVSKSQASSSMGWSSVDLSP